MCGVKINTSLTTQLSAVEQIYALTKQHIETSFDYGLWELNSSGSCVSTKCKLDDIDQPEAYYDLVRSAVLLFSQQSLEEAGLVLQRAFALVKPIIETGNVRALNFFWASLAYLTQSGHPEIAAMLISHIRDWARVVLKPSHAVVRLFGKLASTPIDELEMLVHNTWQVTADTFEGRLPPLHPEYVRQQCDLLYRIYGTKFPATAKMSLEALLKGGADTNAPELSHLTILNALAYNALNSSDWAQATTLGKKLEDRARSGQGKEFVVYQLGGLEIQGRALMEMQMWEYAVECLAKATMMIADEWGSQDPWRIELMALQQECLRDHGAIQAADSMKANIASLVNEIV